MMDKQPSRSRWLKRSLASLVVAGSLMILVHVALAHPFSDVPAGVVSQAVDWIWSRGITTGCTATLYCPNDPVTRGQMAIFMNRLGKVLSPVYHWVEADPGALDIDADPMICATPDFTPTFPMRALVIGSAALRAGGALGAHVALIYSSDAGVAWSSVNNWNNRIGASAEGEWDSTTKTGTMTLAVGTPYRFAIRLLRHIGTADATESRCDLMVQFTNGNPDGISPDAAPKTPAARRGEQQRR